MRGGQAHLVTRETTRKFSQQPLGPCAQALSYRYQTNTRLIAEAIHLPLFFSVEKIVVVLHADELGPASPLSRELHRRKLVGPHAARSDVSYLPTLHQVVQCLHSLLDGCGLVEAVDLEEIDVGCVQTSQRGIDGVEDALSRQAALIDVVDGLVNVLEREGVRVISFPGSAAALGQDNELLPWYLVLFDRFADDLLGNAVAVDVGCIPLQTE